MEDFRFKHFSLSHTNSSLKIGTDSVLLGTMVPLCAAESVLDVGCGCGVISFCIAWRMGNVFSHRQLFVGVDIDKNSVDEANANALRFPKKANQQFSFFHQDIQSYAEQTSSRYDLIVSNPPFFGSSLKPDDKKKLLSKHRDHNLSFEALLTGILSLLSENGSFCLILPPAESSCFHSLAASSLFLASQFVIRPTTLKKPNRIISVYQKVPVDTFVTNELCIRDETGNYTEAYRQLTGDFYL